MTSNTILMLMHSKRMLHLGPLLNSKRTSICLCHLSIYVPNKLPKPNSCLNQAFGLQLSPPPKLPPIPIFHISVGISPAAPDSNLGDTPPAFLLLHPPCSSLATLWTPACEHLFPPSLLASRSRLWVSCTGWIAAAADIWTQCLYVGPPRVPSTSSS